MDGTLIANNLQIKAMTTPFPYPGSHWWKVEFHCHTPASSDYGKGPNQQALQKVTPEEWLLNYMRAGFDCVAITDHNSGDWIDRLKEAVTALQGHADYRPLTIFPGVELSINGGVHLLAIFDPSKGGADILHLLGAVGFQGTRGSSDDVTQRSLVEVVKIATDCGALAIPAHVDQPSGALTVINDGNSLRQLLECQEIMAAELVDITFKKPAIYQEVKTAWTEVLGSDAHHPTGNADQRSPGSHYTWVKMGNPTLEGLRLALIDGAPLSILRSETNPADPNQFAAQLIEEIQVRDARYCGRGIPLQLRFNPWLNTLIGGRGTGKSTAVEFLRVALQRQQELTGKLAESFHDFLRVPNNREDEGAITPNTEVQVIYRKDNARYRLQWRTGATAPIIEEEQADGTWISSVGDVKQRFPVRIFSQKQIFSLAEAAEGLVQVIDESSTVNRTGWNSRWAEEETRFYSLRAKSRELKTQLEQEPRLQGELQDVLKKIKLFEGSENATVLQSFQRRQQQHTQINQFSDNLSTLETSLRTIAAEIIPGIFDEALFDTEDVVEGAILTQLKATSAVVNGIQSEVLGLAKRIQDAQNVWKRMATESSWAKQRTVNIEAYEQLVQQLKDQGVEDPSQYGKLVQKRQELEQQLKKLAEVRQNLETLDHSAAESLCLLAELRRELTTNRSSFLKSILQDNRHVQLEVIPFGRSSRAFASQFRSLINRQDGFEGDILSPDEKGGLASEIYANLPCNAQDAAAEIERRLGDLKAKLLSAASGNTVDGWGKRFCNFVASFPPEVRDRIETWYPGDSLNASYSQTGDGQNFRSIQQGSPGQRTAAMLAFLLAYGNEPMILDQPEDDLDNHLIYDLIVKQLRENKRRRQLIVVTHNANIVVNGDAELVVPLDFRTGQCWLLPQGSLQEGSIREEVCRVMEGGRLAFSQRYRRLTEGGRNV